MVTLAVPDISKHSCFFYHVQQHVEFILALADNQHHA
jgi:hypothetical protein